tara:strand:- start:16182 stop:17357 length:1176 start_codon:yes stop_codon:yes gene_type:complete
MKNSFNFQINTNVISGYNVIDSIYNFLIEKSFKNVLIVADKQLIKNSKYIKKYLKKIKNKKIIKGFHYFSGASEPTYQDLDYTIKKLGEKKKLNLDCLIGIGGGSTIDFTKGIATLLKNKGKALNYRGFPQKIKRSIPVIAVPSTTGTGAEVAYNAVFTDLKSKKKLGINTKNNYPILSILDPRVTANAPKKVILNSSLGALIRSIDTMFNKKASKISRILSEKSFQLLYKNLPKVLRNNNNLEYWSEMQWGSYFSVVALLNSSSGPAANLSYYLSSNYSVPQGLGYGISGICFFKRNHEKRFYEYYKLFDLVNKNQKKISKKEKSLIILNSIENIFKANKIKIKNTYIPYTKKNNFFESLSKKYDISESNNPLKLKKKDLKIVVDKIFNI